jgi:tetratricopeptide (TPR) repeat protein
MGFRMRKSFKIAPGVRLNVSKTGLGVSAGVRGARYSVHSSGRRTTSVGLPGTGMGWTSTGTSKSSSRSSSSAVPQRSAPVKPGVFAPKGEKLLYEAVRKSDPAALQRIAQEHPEQALVALSVAGFQVDNHSRAQELLGWVFTQSSEPFDEPFIQKYIPNTRVQIQIATGVSAELPLNRDAVGLYLAELLQAAGDLESAVDVVEQLEPTSYAAVSLAELYSQSGRHEQVIELTEGIQNEDDSTALLLVIRGVALREMGLAEGALTSFKEALRLKSRPSAIRHLALFERAKSYATLGKRAQARKDLERIFAEDSTYPSIKEALEALKP